MSTNMSKNSRRISFQRLHTIYTAFSRNSFAVCRNRKKNAGLSRLPVFAALTHYDFKTQVLPTVRESKISEQAIRELGMRQAAADKQHFYRVYPPVRKNVYNIIPRF